MLGFVERWHLTLLANSFHEAQSGAPLENLPVFGITKQPAPAVDEDYEADRAVGEGAHSGGEEDPEAGGGELHENAERKAEVLRERCNNTMHYVILLLGDEHRARVMRMLAHLAVPVWKVHNKAVHYLRSVSEVLLYNSGLAKGFYFRVLRKEWSLLLDNELADKLWFKMELEPGDLSGAPSSSSSPSSEIPTEMLNARLADERYYADKAFSFVRRLVRYRSLSALHFTMGAPGFFVLLLDADEAIRREGLERARDLWHALSTIEQRFADTGDISLKKVLKGLSWCDHVAIRETLIYLAQVNFSFVPVPIAEVWQTHFEGWCQSGIIENAGNRVNDAQRQSKNRRQSRVKRFYVPHAKELISEYKRPEVEMGPTDPPPHE